MVIYGGFEGWASFDNVWELSLAEPMAWTRLEPSGKDPGLRFGHAAIFDEPRRRMIVIGGIERYLGSGPIQDIVHDDVWALNLDGAPRWIRLFPDPAGPGDRSFHSAMLDPVRRQVIVLGGNDRYGQALSDAMALPIDGGSAWQMLPLRPSFPESGGLLGGIRGHTAVYDDVADQMVVFGGTKPSGVHVSNEVWFFDLANGLRATQIGMTGPHPAPRTAHAAAWDASRRRMLISGGYDGHYFSDVWELKFEPAPRWRFLTNMPWPPRAYHAMTYDARTDQLFVFGGENDQGVLDVEIWREGPGWSQLVPLNEGPKRSAAMSIHYDSERSVLVVYGGRGETALETSLWLLDMNTRLWSEVPLREDWPRPRWLHAAVSVPGENRMIIHGGLYSRHQAFSDTWEVSGWPKPRWIPLAPPFRTPHERAYSAAAYDPVAQQAVVVGGYGGRYAEHSNDVWRLDLNGPTAWHRVTTQGEGPPPLNGAAAVYDPLAGTLLLFGGNAGVSQVGATPQNDVWSLSLRGQPAWSKLDLPGARPPARFLPSLAYDPVDHRMVVFGGTKDYFERFSDAWFLALGGDPHWELVTERWERPPFQEIVGMAFDSRRQRVLAVQDRGSLWEMTPGAHEGWQKLNVRNAGAQDIAGASLAYDEHGDRLLLFGGDRWWGTDAFWELGISDRTWRMIQTDKRSPGFRYYAASLVLPESGKLLLYGGAYLDGGPRGDAWFYPLGNPGDWQPWIPPGEGPRPRYGAAVFPHPDGEEQVVIAGGRGEWRWYDDLWTMTTSGEALWTSVPTQGIAPKGLFGAIPVFDPIGRRALFIAGYQEDEWIKGRVWQVMSEGGFTWGEMSVGGEIAPSFYGNPAVFDPSANRVLVLGQPWQGAQVWQLLLGDRRDDAAMAHEGPKPRFELSSVGPNPTRGAFTARFTLKREASAVIEIVDIAGRRVHSEPAGGLGPGNHVVRFGSENGLAPGIYVVRLKEGELEQRKKIVVVR